MAKPWSEVANSEGYKSLPPDQQEAARNQYFDQVVAPRAPQDKIAEVRAQFDSATKAQAPVDNTPPHDYRMPNNGQPTEDAAYQPTLSELDSGKPEPKLKLPDATPRPSNARVFLNSLVKGAASVPDMYAGMQPTNLVRIAADAVQGKPVTLMPTTASDLAEQAGLINKKYEPQDIDQRAIDVAGQGIGAGFVSGIPSGIKTAATSAISGLVGNEAGQLAVEAGYPLAGAAINMATGTMTAGGINKLTGKTQDIASKARNAVMDENIAKARDAGYVFPVSQTNPRSLLANAIDIATGGRPKNQQTAAIKNAEIRHREIAKQVGLDPDAPIKPADISARINDEIEAGYKPIKDMAGIKPTSDFFSDIESAMAPHIEHNASFPESQSESALKILNGIKTNEIKSGASALQKIRELRADANSYLSPMNVDPEARKLGAASKEAADILERELGRQIEKNAGGGSLKAYQAARKNIAQLKEVEGALNEATGSITGAKLAKSKSPLTGAMADARTFAGLPGANFADTKYATPAGGQLENAMALAMAEEGGNLAWLGVPAIRAAGRNAMLRPSMQRLLGTPSYSKAGIEGENIAGVAPGAVNQMLLGL